ncbi:MAG: hypothetical protein ACJA1C_001998 [Crocinitomicaceae bacterium]
MQYFKYIWNEARGDQFDFFGKSVWYFEIDHDSYISRQLELYSTGLINKYSANHKEDQFGFLGYSHFDSKDFDEIVLIEGSEFENKWSNIELPSPIVDNQQFNLFEKYNGDYDVLTDFRNGSKEDFKKVQIGTFPLLNQIINDLTCLKTGQYSLELQNEMEERIFKLSPLLNKDVYDKIKSR